MMHIATTAAAGAQAPAWPARADLLGAQAHARLQRVIQQAWLRVYGGRWAFDAFPAEAAAQRISPEAIALVREGPVWRQLVPYLGPGEALRVLCFHFPPGLDHSGFAEWLGGLIRQNVGDGVFVTRAASGAAGACSDAGGVFDYWGIPDAIGDEVIGFVAELAAGRPS